MESLELLRVVINDKVKTVGEKINKSFSEKEYEKIPYYSSLAKEIGFYEKRIEEISDSLDVDDVIIQEEINNEVDARTITNYSEYFVDHNVEHTLYENFTHKRPFGFKLSDNHIVEVTTWQDMLVKTCEYLIILDEQKFMGFENKKLMNGKKNKYFSTSIEGMCRPKKIADKIYVETNQSANAIRNLIMKLLKKFSFNIRELKVYFKANYTILKEK